ncbi:MAG: hypothetical protein QM775_04760 [Pirellulales bacterium]
MRIRHAARDERREQLAEALRIDDVLREKQTELEGLREEARRLQHLKTGPVNVDRLLEGQRYEAIVAVEIAHVVSQRNNVAEEIRKRREARRGSRSRVQSRRETAGKPLCGTLGPVVGGRDEDARRSGRPHATRRA